MGARYKPNRKGVGLLLQSPMIATEMLRRAEVIRGVAVAISPVGGAGDPHPGAYRAAWEATVVQRRVGRTSKPRAVGIVRNPSYYARWVEYGTERVHAHHVLLRAAQAGGR
ncbi:HK97 gp10 family phage protein [Streptomyces sp. NRRL F-5630]|uniref:HK97 gp10 family phage protein n=1 Tax=Streptomyces sp. NRRL F-5630 TaxID=1463864 RepID=UPI003EBB0645